jgi:hypothetical protein
MFLSEKEDKRSGAMKSGRKLAAESQAGIFRERLVAWRQIPESQRPSLRALAQELGTTHQLLSFYLNGLNDWQRREYLRKSQEIRAKGVAMTWADEQQGIALERAALATLVDSAVDSMLREIEADKKTGKVTRKQIKIVELVARKGFPAAKKLLQSLKSDFRRDRHFIAKLKLKS